MNWYNKHGNLSDQIRLNQAGLMGMRGSLSGLWLLKELQAFFGYPDFTTHPNRILYPCKLALGLLKTTRTTGYQAWSSLLGFQQFHQFGLLSFLFKAKSGFGLVKIETSGASLVVVKRKTGPKQAMCRFLPNQAKGNKPSRTDRKPNPAEGLVVPLKSLRGNGMGTPWF